LQARALGVSQAVGELRSPVLVAALASFFYRLVWCMEPAGRGPASPFLFASCRSLVISRLCPCRRHRGSTIDSHCLQWQFPPSSRHWCCF
jgi:hypothetical protein